MALNAGAIVAELMDERKLNNDIGRRVVHFRLVGQFLGFAGSSGPAHVTYRVGITHQVSKLWNQKQDSWLAVEVLCLLGWGLVETSLRLRLGLDEKAE